jgi:cytoskeletal protein RodZ
MPTPTGSDRSNGAGIGSTLRRARADRGLSLADLQARTKIRAKYLAALEDERFRDLPPYPFARGFLYAVAKELRIDPEPLVRRLEPEMASMTEPGAARWQRLDGAIKPAVPASPLRRLAIIAAATLAVAGVALVLFFAQQLRELSEPAPPTASPAAPSAEQAQGAVAPSPQAPSSQETPTEAAQPEAAAPAAPDASGAATPPQTNVETPVAPAPPGGVTVDVQATGRSWLRVLADGRPAFEGFVSHGDARRWQATRTISLRVGNAGAVALTVNGKAMGSPGRIGEVIDRTFSTDDAR